MSPWWKNSLLALSFFVSSPAWAGTVFNPFTGQPDYCLTVTEEDGSPTNASCGTLEVTNGGLTADGDGNYSLDLTAGGPTGSGVANEVAYWSSSSVLTSDNSFTFNPAGSTTDMLSIIGANATSALTSGSALVVSGPSGATAGMTDALVKLTSDIQGSTGLVSITGTVDSTDGSGGIGLNLALTNTPTGTAAATTGLNFAVTDTSALANQVVGIGGQIDATGNTSAGTFTNYAAALTNTGTTVGTTTGVGLSITTSLYDNNYALITTAGDSGFGDSTPDAFVDVTDNKAGNLTAERIGFLSETSATRTLADGTALTNQRLNQFKGVTYNGVAGGGSESITNAATLYVDAAPTQGSNLTISNTYAAWFDAGTVRIDGDIDAQGGLTCTDCIALTTETSGNYVATVADGTGIDGTASGEGTTYTPTFDATELTTLTWGAGGGGFTWTFDATLNDPTLTFAASTITIGGAATTLVLPAGSAAAPPLAFTGALTSGVYAPGSGQVGLTASGADVFNASAANAIALSGSSTSSSVWLNASPSISGAGTKSTYMLVTFTYNPSSAAAVRMINFDMQGQNSSTSTLGVAIRGNASKTNDSTSNNVGLWIQAGIGASQTSTSSWTNNVINFVVTNCGAGNCTAGNTTYNEILGHAAPTNYSNLTFNFLNAPAGAVILNSSNTDADFTYDSQTFEAMVFFDASTDRVGVQTSSPSTTVAISGEQAQTLRMERELTAATAGRNFTVLAGGAVSGGTNLAGGDLQLQSGEATGNGESKLLVQTVNSGQGSGTSDRSPATVAQFDEGHLEFFDTAPTVSACGAGTPTVSTESTDHSGKVTVGTGVLVTSCTLTFSLPAFTNAPHCVANNETQILLVQAISTTTTLTLNSATTFDEDVLSWVCLAAE